MNLTIITNRCRRNINDTTLLQAIEEGFVYHENIAIDACHFEARDQSIT